MLIHVYVCRFFYYYFYYYFCISVIIYFFFFQAEDGIRDFCLSRGLGDVYKRQTFMSLLLDTGLPYARLALFTPETPECLLLPRNDERADALGEGLRAAGAADVVKYLKQL